MVKRVQVVAAVIHGSDGHVLVSKRLDHLHQGGLWEFPGGKQEPDETELSCLGRELREELGIIPRVAFPLIRVEHDYPDKSVSLSVWRVLAFNGEARGREGQPLYWLAPNDLADLAFPAANLPIVSAASLPSRYLITAPDWRDPELLHEHTKQQILRGGSLFQLRVPVDDWSLLSDLAEAMKDAMDGSPARLLVNGGVDVYERIRCDGVHLPWREAESMSQADIADIPLSAVSCHNAEELRHAENLKADFALLSPVRSTPSHPGSDPLGWPAFRRLVKGSALPVYALGGLREADLAVARSHGAQGVAGISGFWLSEQGTA